MGPQLASFLISVIGVLEETFRESIYHFHYMIIRDLIWVIPERSSGFPYFPQFQSEFGNKEFMI